MFIVEITKKHLERVVAVLVLANGVSRDGLPELELLGEESREPTLGESREPTFKEVYDYWKNLSSDNPMKERIKSGYDAVVEMGINTNLGLEYVGNIIVDGYSATHLSL